MHLPVKGREAPRSALEDDCSDQRLLLLHRRDRVRVGVEGDRDGGVAEALRDDLEVDAGLRRESGVRRSCRPIVGSCHRASVDETRTVGRETEVSVHV